MGIPVRILLAVCCVGAGAGAAEQIPARPLAQKRAVVLADTFDGSSPASRWKTVFPLFAVIDGTLKGSQARDDHGAVIETNVPLRDGNLILELRFRFEGARSIHVLCDDKTWQGVHAGHISRVVIAPHQITLYDDKEGLMRDDIFALRKSKDPADRAEAQRLATSRWQAFPLNLEMKRWYRFGLEIYGDEMRATLDGRTVAFLKSAGLAHSRKSDLRINVWGNGGDALIDDLIVWEVDAPTL